VTWTGWLIVIPGASYALAALVYAYQRNWPFAIVYSGYCWANAGLWWLDKIQGHTP
jgi:hypothetical protein